MLLILPTNEYIAHVAYLIVRCSAGYQKDIIPSITHTIRYCKKEFLRQTEIESLSDQQILSLDGRWGKMRLMSDSA